MAGPFTYLNNIPQPTDLLSVSQGDLLTNFASIESFVDIDHVDFSAGNAGQHAKVTLPVQSPAPAFAAGSYGLYNATDGLNNQLYLSNDFTATQVPISKGNLPSIGFSGFQVGYTYLPSGFLVKWGPLFVIPANATTVINFPVIDAGAIAIPVFTTACVGAWITNISGGTPSQVLSVQAVSATQITVYNSGATASGIFLAIGY